MEASDGGVAEWSIALVLKTSVPKGTQGSNPCPSDIHLCRISQNAPPTMRNAFEHAAELDRVIRYAFGASSIVQLTSAFYFDRF